MSPGHPFLRAVLAAPDDDAPRLVYADWLDDHDQPDRAEFVPVQVELARGDWTPARRRELLVAHEAGWVAPLAEALDCPPGEWGGWVFRRGFVEYFRLPAAVLNRRGARLTPVRELLVERCGTASLVSLCGKAWMRSVTGLYLWSARLTPAVVRVLVESPYLGAVRRLNVGPLDLPAADAKALRDRFGAALDERVG